MALFLPWSGEVRSRSFRERKLYLPRRARPLEDSCFHNIRAPYLCLPNAGGILRSFLKALEGESTEEAMGYLSASVTAGADLESIKKLFHQKKNMYMYSDYKDEATCAVSLACKGETGKTEVISIRMVAEPDSFGKWKIYCIEKE